MHLLRKILRQKVSGAADDHRAWIGMKRRRRCGSNVQSEPGACRVQGGTSQPVPPQSISSQEFQYAVVAFVPPFKGAANLCFGGT